MQGKLVIPTFTSSKYALNSIYKLCIDDWNKITTELNPFNKGINQQIRELMPDDFNLLDISRNRLKELIKNCLLVSYKNE